MAPDLNSLPPSTARAMNNSFSHPPPAASSTPASASSHGEPNQAAIVMGESPPSSAARRGSVSLQAAATMNAGLQHEPPRRSSSSSLSRNKQSPSSQTDGRRRSAILHNLHLNDPSIPAPGEMLHDTSPLAAAGHGPASPPPLSASPLLTGGDPQHRSRAPSLGELHQELEAEQEAQVNRLLHMIRQQQVQLQQLQAAQGHPPQSTVAAEDAPPASSDQLSSLPHAQPPSAASLVSHSSPHPALTGPSTPRSPVMSSHPRSSFDMTRPDLRSSRRSSRGASSPILRSASINAEGAEPWLLGGATGSSGVRDESAFYQAETQSLIRENQMLRHRIRELERQLGDTHANASVTREPAHPSHLLQSTSASEEAPIARPGSVAVTESSTPAPNTPKEE